MAKNKTEIKVLRDTRENPAGGRWDFSNTKEVALKTGDYTISGFKDVFVIERKGCVSEFATNLFEERFERELQRLEDYDFPFIFLEFNMSDLINFPHGSGIPKREWPKLKVTGRLLLKRVMELQVKYKTKILFVGSKGKECAESLFKRILELKNV